MPPTCLLTTPIGYKCGKFTDVTLITDSYKNVFELDLLFFPKKITPDSKVGEKFNLDYNELKSCVGRMRIMEDDFTQIGDAAIANLFNVNMTFSFKDLYMILVYQSDKKLSFNKDLSLNLGYELGDSF